jgi:hypothetical protein
MRCPFCGDEGEVEEVGVATWPIYAVVCQGCGSVGPGRERQEAAVAAWDARPPFAGLPAIPPAIRRERVR